MKYTFNHFNFNVRDLEKSLKFYEEAIGLKVARSKEAADGRYKIVFLKDEDDSPFQLELTWLRDHEEAYDLGEQEYHLAFVADDYQAAYEYHKEKGWICFENPEMGIYFLEDPDGYWIEIIPPRK